MRRRRSHTNPFPGVNLLHAVANGVLPAAVALAHLLETEMDRALQIEGLTARGFLALLEIHREGPATQRDLARRLRLVPSATCEMLARLERRRLVTRRGAPRLTPAGAETLARAAALVGRLEREWERRLRSARGPYSGSILPATYGLRRLLREGLAALAPPARRPPER